MPVILDETNKVSFKKTDKDRRKVSTAIPELDSDMQGGINCGDIGYVMASSGKGKSIYIDSAAVYNAKFFNEYRNEHFVFLFLFEQSAETRIKRMACSEAGVTLAGASGTEVTLPPMNLIIFDEDDKLRGTMEDIEQKIRDTGFKPGIVYIDYMANMDALLGKPHDEYKVQNRKMERMALRLDCPVISGIQARLTEGFDYNEGHLLDERNITECKALKNASRLFFSINQSEAQYASSTCTVNVFKNSSGPLKTYDCYMDLKTFTFGEGYKYGKSNQGGLGPRPIQIG